MGRKMYAYLGYRIASSKGDPKRGRYLAKSRSHGTWGFWRVWSGWSGWLPIWIYLNSIICNLKWRVDFSFLFFSLSLSFREDNSSLLCWNILNFFGVFEWGSFCGMNLWYMRWWLRGYITGKSGCQYSEWVTDRSAMFGLANGGFMWDKDLKMASTLPGVDAPFDKAQSKFR